MRFVEIELLDVCLASVGYDIQISTANYSFMCEDFVKIWASPTFCQVTLGPGPVAHVSTAEAMIRKTLREVELELHYQQRRSVPPEPWALIFKQLVSDSFL